MVHLHGNIHAMVSLQAIRFAVIRVSLCFENMARELDVRLVLPGSRSSIPRLTHSACHRVKDAAGQPCILFASLPIVALRRASRNFAASGGICTGAALASA